MSVMPLNLIKGTRSVMYERLENTEDIDDVEHQIEKLKSKVSHSVRRSTFSTRHTRHKYTVGEIIYESLNKTTEQNQAVKPHTIYVNRHIRLFAVCLLNLSI